MILVDPFDLPGWLGEGRVLWAPDAGIRVGHHVTGVLSRGEDTLVCDLMAVDEAYPAPVADDGTRTDAHQAWHYGQVLLVERHERLTLAVPGRDFTADLVLEALSRLAKAVGASTDDYAAILRIGTARG